MVKFDQLLLYNYLMRATDNSIPICNELKDKMEEMKMANFNIATDTYTTCNATTLDNMTAEEIKRAINAVYGGVTYKGEAKLEKSSKSETPEEKEEKWVWVAGYKGLDKDMKAYGGFQYEMDKLYIMPEGEPVEACHGGFHLCLNLKDLYGYKSIGSGNRFFECSALVRESDLEKYGTDIPFAIFGPNKVNKLAAKSIRLIRELSIDEILAHIDGVEEWPEYVKEMAITKDIDAAKKELKLITMTKMGYARPLAEYILNDRNSEDGYKLAVALDSQPGISMNTKVNAIFSHI